MESFVLKGFEARHLNITNNVSFETELPVDCSKVIWLTITAIFSSTRRVLTCIPGVLSNTTVSPSRRQPPYLMESFVSKGFETVYLTILNYISFEAELHVDCSKAFWNIINAILPSPNEFLLCVPGVHLSMFKQASAPISYEKFCIKRVRDCVSYHIELEIVDQWSTKIPPPQGRGSKGQWVDSNRTLLKITSQPFWKQYSWKSLGFCLQPQRTCTWNLKLKFQSKLEFRCPNHAAYRVQKPKNLTWPPGSHLENEVTENQEAPTHIHKYWAIEVSSSYSKPN